MKRTNDQDGKDLTEAQAPSSAAGPAASEGAGANGEEPEGPEQASPGAAEGAGEEAAGASAAAEVEALRAELQATQDKLLRQAAEFQNYRRRTEQEKAELVELGRRLVVQQLLDVWDDFSRSLEAAGQMEQEENVEAAYQVLRQGIDLVYRKFTEEMNRLGVEPIEAAGKPFDENEHEAMLQQPAPEGTPPGTVLSEFQRGYRMGGRVLRHSRVVVSA